MTRSVDASEPPLATTIGLVQQNNQGRRDGGYIRANSVEFHSQKLILLLLPPNILHTNRNLDSGSVMAPSSGRTAGHVAASWCYHAPSTQRGQQFVLTEIEPLSRYRFALSVHRAAEGAIIRVLIAGVVLMHGISHNITRQQKKRESGPRPGVASGHITHSMPYTCSRPLREMLRDGHFRGWKAILQGPG